MPKYKSVPIAQLTHQLTLSPRRQRLAQVAGAERLLELLAPAKEYPYDFVCFHLTGYRPLRPTRKPLLKGEALIADIVRLIEHLSQSAAIPAAALSTPIWTQEQLSERLSVSMKTLARWRQRGLSGWRVLDGRNHARLVFTEESLQRFIAANHKMVLRGGAFRQLSESERAAILKRARELVASRRLKLQEVARLIACQTGRAIETIRYTIQRHDEQHPESALFSPEGRPRIPEQYAQIYRGHQRGTPLRELAKRFLLTQTKIQRICTEMRAYELLSHPIQYVYNPEFDSADATWQIIDAHELVNGPSSKTHSPRAPSGATAYVQALYRIPLLTAEQERDLFRRYNYCKHKAHHLTQHLDPCRARRRQLAEIDRHIKLADRYQNQIIQANLRLVVKIAQRHRSPTTDFSELISDGNISLMRAVERFDYARGFKFSTYASWTIIKNYARSIPAERYRYVRCVTGRAELLDSAPERAPAAETTQALEAQGLRLALASGLKSLEQREREILSAHFGLTKSSARTLEQIGRRFGVTKERIRQIEKRALAKLQKILPAWLAEYAE